PTLQGVAFARRAGEFGFRRRGEWGCGSRKAETKSRLGRPGGPRHYGGRRGESTRRRLRAGGPPSHGLLDVQANVGFGGRGEWGLRKPKSRDEISAQQAWRPAPLWRAARLIDEASIAGRGPALPRVARRAGEFGFRRARGMGGAEAEKPRRNLGSAGLAARATMAGGAVNRRGVDCGPGAHPPTGCFC